MSCGWPDTYQRRWSSPEIKVIYHVKMTISPFAFIKQNEHIRISNEPAQNMWRPSHSFILSNNNSVIETWWRTNASPPTHAHVYISIQKRYAEYLYIIKQISYGSFSELGHHWFRRWLPVVWRLFTLIFFRTNIHQAIKRLIVRSCKFLTALDWMLK